MTLAVQRKNFKSNDKMKGGGVKEKKLKGASKKEKPTKIDPATQKVIAKKLKHQDIKEDGPVKADGKPEWAGIKKQHKEATVQRKEKRNASIHEELSAAKKLFEKIRSNKCPIAEREEHIKKLALILKGNLSKMVMRHDTARIIQWILKLGPTKIKEGVVNEIINDVVSLARNKYSNHIVKSIVKSCSSLIRRKLVQNCKGHVLKLLNSKIAAPIIEDVYSNYANNQEKIAFKKELFGDLLKNSDECDLAKALESNPTLKPAILSTIKSTLNQLLSKKWSYRSNLVMSVVSDFVQNCEEKDRNELFETLRSDISLLIKTKSGANVGFSIIWNSSAKAKKEIVKELKCDLKNIALTDAGSMFLLTLIDSVDDTVLMKKALLPTIIECADKLIMNEHGKRVILYLFAHRDAHFFHPSYLEKLKMADSSVNVKKTQEKRMSELLECCLNPILDQIKDNPKVWFCNGSVGLVTAAIFKQASASGASLNECYASLAKYLTDLESTITKDDKTFHIIEDGGVNKALKQLIKQEKSLQESGKDTMALALATSLTAKTLDKWLTLNRGCFTLVFLLETEIKEVLELLKTKLKKAKTDVIRNSELKGAQILCETAKRLGVL